MSHSHAGRLLIVQDDLATCQSLELALRAEGYRTYATDLGEEGVDLALTYNYDAILLDDCLPDLSGLEVLRSIRARGVTTPVIFMSTAAHDLVVKALDLGADYVLHLICHTDHLKAVLRAVRRRAEMSADERLGARA